MHEKKSCREKDNSSRIMKVKMTIIILSLSLLWIMSLVAAIRLTFTSHDDTAQVTANVSDDVFHITNETTRLAEERWKREGGPSPEDLWRQEEAAKKRDEERNKRLFMSLRPDNFPAPAASSGPDQLDIDAIIAKHYKASRKGIEYMFGSKDMQTDPGIQTEIKNMEDQYAIEHQALITYLVGMVKRYGLTGTVIVFTSVLLTIWFGVLTICELIRWLILRFCGYVISHLV